MTNLKNLKKQHTEYYKSLKEFLHIKEDIEDIEEYAVEFRENQLYTTVLDDIINLDNFDLETYNTDEYKLGKDFEGVFYTLKDNLSVEEEWYYDKYEFYNDNPNYLIIGTCNNEDEYKAFYIFDKKNDITEQKLNSVKSSEKFKSYKLFKELKEKFNFE
jgi:hypothetical protein